MALDHCPVSQRIGIFTYTVHGILDLSSTIVPGDQRETRPCLVPRWRTLPQTESKITSRFNLHLVSLAMASNGAEAAVHAARLFRCTLIADHVVSIKIAFNPDKMLKAVKDLVSTLFPFIPSVYSSPLL